MQPDRCCYLRLERDLGRCATTL